MSALLLFVGAAFFLAGTVALFLGVGVGVGVAQRFGRNGWVMAGLLLLA